MHKKLLVGALSLTLSIAAHAEGAQLYTKAGSMGYGLGVATSLGDSFGARLGGNYFTYSKDRTYQSNNYSADVKFSSFEALLDWYFAGNFKLSAGGIYNRNKLDLVAKLSGGNMINFNGQSYAVNSANAEVDLGRSTVTPYLGLGYSKKPKSGSGFGFYADLGVTFQDPKSKINVDAPGYNNDPIFQANKAAEEKKLNDEVSNAKAWPVIAIGVTYTF